MRFRLIAAALLLTGCGATSVSHETQAVRDFVAVTDLARVRNIRLYQQLRYGYVNDYFVIVVAGNRHYLVEFNARCWALRRKEFTASMVDHRHDPSYLLEGDTIRGCPVGKIYKATAEQLIEVKSLGKSQATGTAVPTEGEAPPVQDISSNP